MDEKQLAEYRDRYISWMRALSKDEMNALAILQHEGMRNVAPMNDDYMRGMAQTTNMRPQMPADEALPDKPKPTLWQRLRAFFCGDLRTNL